MMISRKELKSRIRQQEDSSLSQNESDVPLVYDLNNKLYRKSIGNRLDVIIYERGKMGNNSDA